MVSTSRTGLPSSQLHVGHMGREAPYFIKSLIHPTYPPYFLLGTVTPSHWTNSYLSIYLSSPHSSTIPPFASYSDCCPVFTSLPAFSNIKLAQSPVPANVFWRWHQAASLHIGCQQSLVADLYLIWCLFSNDGFLFTWLHGLFLGWSSVHLMTK